MWKFPSTWSNTFSSFFSETRLCPSGCTSVNVCRLPAGVVSPNFAREIIHFETRFQGVKKREKEGERGRNGGREREDGISWTEAAQPILITRHVYRDPWNLDASVQRPPPPFSSYLNAFYYVRREREGERRFHEIMWEKGGNNATSHLKI